MVVRGAEAAGRPQRRGGKIPIASDVARVGAGEDQEDTRSYGNWAGVNSRMMLHRCRVGQFRVDKKCMARQKKQTKDLLGNSHEELRRMGEGREGVCVCRDHGADLRPKRTEGRKKHRLQCFAQEATTR